MKYTKLWWLLLLVMTITFFNILNSNTYAQSSADSCYLTGTNLRIIKQCGPVCTDTTNQQNFSGSDAESQARDWCVDACNDTQTQCCQILQQTSADTPTFQTRCKDIITQVITIAPSRGTFDCGEISSGSCEAINNRCDRGQMVGTCNNRCGQTNLPCVTPTPTPTPTLAPNTFDCEEIAPGTCVPRNHCADGYRVETCSGRCGQTDIPCTKIPPFPNPNCQQYDELGCLAQPALCEWKHNICGPKSGGTACNQTCSPSTMYQCATPCGSCVKIANNDYRCCNTENGGCQLFPTGASRQITPNPTPTTLPSPIPFVKCLDFQNQESECISNGCSYNYNNGNCIPIPGTFQCNQICINPENPLQYDPNATSYCAPECGTCIEYPRDGTHRCLGANYSSEGDDTSYLDYNPCQGFDDIDGACAKCHESEGVWTAIGCIPTSPTQFTTMIIRTLFGLAGGIGFLILLYGAFLCLTARGDAQKTQACRETITAAIVGILMLIFSIFIINLIFGPYGFLPGYVNIFGS